MAWRVGVGPVFAFEWLMASRRWQPYALRSLTVLLLLGSMAPIWLGGPPSGVSTVVRRAEEAKSFFERTAVLLLGLVGLAAPAATAGAICQDKARGNLALLLATDLSDAEIVLGKLAARLVPVLGLILCTAPVLAIASLFGGIDPAALIGTLLVLLACALFGCSLALTLSVWGHRMHEVLMATYIFGILYVLSAPIYSVLRPLLPTGWWTAWLPTFWDLLRYNPIFLVLATVNAPPVGIAPVTIATQATFFGMGLVASSLMLGVATRRIRAVVIRQSGGEQRARGRLARAVGPLGRLGLDRLERWAPGLFRLGRRVRRAWPGPSLDRNPMLWRECQRRRLSRWSLGIWGLYGLVCGGFSLATIALMIAGNRLGRDLGAVVNGIQVGAGLLLLSASASTSLAEERQRGSLDVLMATPLSTRAIVWGKWWGAFRAVPPLLILPVLVTTALAFDPGPPWAVPLIAVLILAYGAALTSLGLALATWVPNVGRAAALTVSLYTVMAFAWIPFAMIVFGDNPGDHGPGVAAGSPFLGVGIFSTYLAEGGTPAEFARQTLWTLFWLLAYSAVAVVLLLATLASFNRCLGRVADTSTLDEGARARDGETSAPAEVG